MGVSQGGYWVPRALAFEHRIAAGIADPGVVDVSRAILNHTSKSMQKLVADGEKEKFDKEIRMGERFSKMIRFTMKFRSFPYGTESAYEMCKAAMEMRIDAETARQIECPLLIADPENEQFWPGQPAELADLVGDKRPCALHRRRGRRRPLRAEGAGPARRALLRLARRDPAASLRPGRGRRSAPRRRSGAAGHRAPVRGEGVAGGHPAAADGGDVGERQVVGRPAGADPAGRAEDRLGQRAGQRPHQLGAAERLGREQLQRREAALDQRHRLARPWRSRRAPARRRRRAPRAARASSPA